MMAVTHKKTDPYYQDALSFIKQLTSKDAATNEQVKPENLELPVQWLLSLAWLVNSCILEILFVWVLGLFLVKKETFKIIYTL